VLQRIEELLALSDGPCPGRTAPTLFRIHSLTTPLFFADEFPRCRSRKIGWHRTRVTLGAKMTLAEHGFRPALLLWTTRPFEVREGMGTPMRPQSVLVSADARSVGDSNKPRCLHPNRSFVPLDWSTLRSKIRPVEMQVDDLLDEVRKGRCRRLSARCVPCDQAHGGRPDQNTLHYEQGIALCLYCPTAT